MTGPVPSVLPEEGLDLHTELERYRDWIIDQAMLRCAQNAPAAAKLIGFSPEGLRLNLRARGIPWPRARAGRKPSPESTSAPAAPAAPPSVLQTERQLTRLAARVPWDRVSELRANGMSDGRIAHYLSGIVGEHRFTLEKVLARRQEQQP